MGFFVLSGYCIQLSVGRLAGRRAGSRSGSTSRPGSSRILPLYYLRAALRRWRSSALVAPIRPGLLPERARPRSVRSRSSSSSRTLPRRSARSRRRGASPTRSSITSSSACWRWPRRRGTGPARRGSGMVALHRASAAVDAVALRRRLQDLVHVYSIGLLFGLGIALVPGGAGRGPRAGAGPASAGPDRSRRPGRWSSPSAVIAEGRRRAARSRRSTCCSGVAFTLMLLRFQAVDAPERGAGPVDARPGVEGRATVWAWRAIRRTCSTGRSCCWSASAIARWGLIVRLAGDAGPSLVGSGLASGVAAGLARRAADHGLAGRTAAAAEGAVAGPSGRRPGDRSLEVQQ